MSEIQEEEPITAEELHEHIQASIFGPSGDHARFWRLQGRLHELVDNAPEYQGAEVRREEAVEEVILQAIRGFVSRVERHAVERPSGIYEAMIAELHELEELAKANRSEYE